MRASEPERTGYVDRDGIRVYYEVYGDLAGPTPIVFTPADTIVDCAAVEGPGPLARRDDTGSS